MKICLDTNCFIDLVHQSHKAHSDMKQIFKLWENGRIDLYISHHSLDQLEKSTHQDGALLYAKQIEILPTYPIGTISELVGTIHDLDGKLSDIKNNDKLKDKIERTAKSGTDIRDQGAYLDALHANMDYFLTSDGQFVRSGPKKRFNENFSLKVISPSELLGLL